MIPRLRWLKPHEIKAQAEGVLDRFHPSRELPIPVEQIVDVGLAIDIIPLPELRAGFDFDAFISNDLTSIYVDEYVCEHYENRYRFTLSHELGHLCLHDYLYKAYTIASVDDFHQFNEALDAKQKADMEWQANRFAGYLLAPDSQIVSSWNALWSALKEMIAEAERHGFREQDYRDKALEAASERMCEDFQVSADCMKRRLLTALDDGVLQLTP